ncbi:hypothetical protein PVK06_016814 [Gossypium arboreum]|uniref:Uncharacterized protein n=1 Tax=Gossypium arboreum TaxID=29729 RepID=A0ABR0Q107_GOSAR|nr:hypothetical protein PVK06_016814 [Gossypium arboreum]
MGSGGEEGFGGDEVSLLAEELIQLSVKSSMVQAKDKPTLICTVWTEKSYNPDSFRAQMKSPYSPELDKKDLLHAIGVTFGGIIRSEINGEFCRLRVNLDVQNPLRTGKTEENQGTHPQEEDSTDVSLGKQDIARLTEVEIMEERPERCIIVDGKSSGNNDIIDGMLKPSKKSSWKRAKSTKERSASVGESKLGKRKLLEIEAGEYGPDGIWEDATKKWRYGQPTLEIVDGIFL